MKIRHVISAVQFDKKTLDDLFRLTGKIRANKFNKNSLSDKILITLFYEPSTRTRLSFESAMLHLSGKVISTENASEFSSAIKGETLEDTIRIVENYCDVIVIRHYSQGASNTAAAISKVPIINAGDGSGEHPTQALLDLYTIFSSFKEHDITVTMIGDLKNGRTIHSLTYLLSLYPKIKIIYISPKGLKIPDDLRTYIKKIGVSFEESENLVDGLKEADVIYQTRIQKERFKNLSEYQRYFGKYVIDKNSLRLMKPNSIIMHPLPRVNEIATEVDRDKRAIYFEEARNGLFVRMALLLKIFDKA